MEAKLIKTIDSYELFTQGFLKGSTNHELIDSLNVEEGNIRYKLSLKNCQAIENGYDLDELVEDNFKGLRDCISDSDIAEFYISLVKTTVTEILGDKKFSEEDMINFAEYCKGDLMKTKDLFNEYQSLQQTEWDVEIETVPALSNNGNVYYGDIPKLDADVCIILKRKL